MTEEQKKGLEIINSHADYFMGNMGDLDRENICVGCRVQPESLPDLIKQYHIHLSIEDRYHKTYPEYKRNFRNWLTTRPKTDKPQQVNVQRNELNGNDIYRLNGNGVMPPKEEREEAHRLWVERMQSEFAEFKKTGRPNLSSTFFLYSMLVEQSLLRENDYEAYTAQVTLEHIETLKVERIRRFDLRAGYSKQIQRLKDNTPDAEDRNKIQALAKKRAIIEYYRGIDSLNLK